MKQSPEDTPIIAFDGNHRCGKGTQIARLEASLAAKGYYPYVLRGDGSRPGTGEFNGDPESEWWQGFKDYVKEFENEYDAWRIGSQKLLAEAAIKRKDLSGNPDAVILFDRSLLSRAQMTIKEGLDPSVNNMYPSENGEMLDAGTIDLLKPDLIIYLGAPINVLVGRLEKDDPKYEFRRQNIHHSSGSFEKAFVSLNGRGEKIVRINGNQHPDVVEKYVQNAIMNRNILNRKVL